MKLNPRTMRHVPFSFEHFRCRVAYGATESLQQLVPLVLAREAKVAEFNLSAVSPPPLQCTSGFLSYVFVFVEHDVLELKVAVHAVVQVHVAKGANELRKYLLRLGDGESAVLDEIVV